VAIQEGGELAGSEQLNFRMLTALDGGGWLPFSVSLAGRPKLQAVGEVLMLLDLGCSMMPIQTLITCSPFLVLYSIKQQNDT